MKSKSHKILVNQTIKNKRFFSQIYLFLIEKIENKLILQKNKKVIQIINLSIKNLPKSLKKLKRKIYKIKRKTHLSSNPHLTKETIGL